MFVILVTINVKPEHREEFIASMLEDAVGSTTNEPGCLRFDVIQDNQDPNRLYLYEVYKDEAAVAAHTKAPHYLRWKETVKDWYAQPNVAGRGHNLFPTNEDWPDKK